MKFRMMFYKSFQEELSTKSSSIENLGRRRGQNCGNHMLKPQLFVTDDDIFNEEYYDNVCSGFI